MKVQAVEIVSLPRLEMAKQKYKIRILVRGMSWMEGVRTYTDYNVAKKIAEGATGLKLLI